MKKFSIILLVCLMCSMEANAIVWVDGAVGNWSNTANWVGGVLPGPADEAQINNGTVYVDQDVTVNLLRMCVAAPADVATLNMTAAGYDGGTSTGKTLTVTGTSANLFVVGYAGAATVNQDTGTVKVDQSSGTLGAINIRYAQANPASFYNLSGGVIDTEVLRGGYTQTNLGLNDTGGTIIARDSIYRLGTYTTVMTWTQGGSTLSPGGSVGTTKVGQSGYETRWTTSASSKLLVELVSGASYDTFLGSGNADLTLGTMNIVASYTPSVGSFFDIIKLNLKTGKAGIGSFGSITDDLPGYFTTQWLDLDATPDGKNETLRFTYVPEPATIALLGLGLIAIRRKK